MISGLATTIASMPVDIAKTRYVLKYPITSSLINSTVRVDHQTYFH